MLLNGQVPPSLLILIHIYLKVLVLIILVGQETRIEQCALYVQRVH